MKDNLPSVWRNIHTTTTDRERVQIAKFVVFSPNLPNEKRRHFKSPTEMEILKLILPKFPLRLREQNLLLTWQSEPAWNIKRANIASLTPTQKLVRNRKVYYSTCWDLLDAPRWYSGHFSPAHKIYITMLTKKLFSICTSLFFGGHALWRFGIGHTKFQTECSQSLMSPRRVTYASVNSYMTSAQRRRRGVKKIQHSQYMWTRRESQQIFATKQTESSYMDANNVNMSAKSPKGKPSSALRGQS